MFKAQISREIKDGLRTGGNEGSVLVKTYDLRAGHNPQASRCGGIQIGHQEQCHRQQPGFEGGAS